MRGARPPTGRHTKDQPTSKFVEHGSRREPLLRLEGLTRHILWAAGGPSDTSQRVGCADDPAPTTENLGSRVQRISDQHPAHADGISTARPAPTARRRLPRRSAGHLHGRRLSRRPARTVTRPVMLRGRSVHRVRCRVRCGAGSKREVSGRGGTSDGCAIGALTGARRREISRAPSHVHRHPGRPRPGSGSSCPRTRRRRVAGGRELQPRRRRRSASSCRWSITPTRSASTALLVVGGRTGWSARAGSAAAGSIASCRRTLASSARERLVEQQHARSMANPCQRTRCCWPPDLVGVIRGMVASPPCPTARAARSAVPSWPRRAPAARSHVQRGQGWGHRL